MAFKRRVLATGESLALGQVLDGPRSPQQCPRCKRSVVLHEALAEKIIVGRCQCPRGEIVWRFEHREFRWRGELTDEGIKANIIRDHEASKRSWEYAGMGWGR